MGDYITVDKISNGEYEEKHSRFIATLYPCKSEEEAFGILSNHKTKYFDARHNVYAFILSDGKSRFSDDGEPHGTAAKPIFDVLSGSGITDALIVVTRYFGGVLLGTGGLVRAYSTAAKEAVNNATPVSMVECSIFSVTLPYSEQNKVVSQIEDIGGDIINTEFTENVKIVFSVTLNKAQIFLDKLCEVSAGKLSATHIENKILPKDTKK